MRKRGSMPEYDGTVRIVTKIDTENASAKAMALGQRLVKLADKAEKAQKELDKFKSTKIPTEEYKQLQSELDKTDAKMEQLYNTQKKLQNKSVSKNSAAWKNNELSIDAAVKKYNQIADAMEKMEANNTAFIDPTATDKYQDLVAKVRNANAEIAIANQRADEFAQSSNKAKFKDLAKSVSQIKNVNKNLTKSTSIIGRFGKKILSLAAGFFIFSTITKAFRAISEAMKEGLQNLARYDSEYNATMSSFKNATQELKNAFGAMAAPLMNLVVPAITQMVKWLTNAVNTVTQLIAALSGKSTWKKATAVNNDYAKSLDGTSKSADKAKGSLQSYNELNNISSNKDSSSGGYEVDKGGFTDEAINPKIADLADNIKDKIKAILDKLNEYKNAFLKGWREGWDRLDVSSQIDKITKSLRNIGKNLKEIVTDADVQAAADHFMLTISEALGKIAVSLFSMGLSIAGNLIIGFDKALEENKDRIKEKLVQFFNVGSDIAYMLGEIFISVADIFQVLMEENATNITADVMSTFMNLSMNLILLFENIVRDIVNLFFIPLQENGTRIKEFFDGILGAVANATDGISSLIISFSDGILSLYTEHISPFFTSITEGFSSILGVVLDWWNSGINPILQKLGTNITNLCKNILIPLVQDVIDIVGDIIDIIKILWEKWLQPYIEWVGRNILPIVTPVIDTIVEAVSHMANSVGYLIKGIVAVVRDVVGLIKSLITGDWAGAWSYAKQIVFDMLGNVLASLYEFVSSVGSVFEGMWNYICAVAKAGLNTAISLVNFAIRALNKINIDIPDWVPGFGGQKFGFNLSEIPQLAHGGITTGATLAEIGEKGKEAVLPLENNTEWMDVFADKMATKVTFEVQGDPNGLFKVVRKEAHDYTQRTGREAFA